MRILYFSPRYTSHDRNFLESLAASGHEIRFLCLLGDQEALEKRPLPAGIRRLHLKGEPESLFPQDLLPAMPWLEEVLEQSQPEIIHAGPVQSAAFMAALCGFHPLLVASWGSDILVDAERNELMQWVTRYTLRRADAFLCDCDAVREAACKVAPMGEDKIVQFPWGVDLNVFFPGRDAGGLRDRLGWGGCKVIVSTRSFEEIYGVEGLIDAFSMAYRKAPQLRLILAGDGSLTARVNGRILEHGLEEVVYRPGRVVHSRLPDLFRASDIYMSCCYSDGSSVSLLEAMATGLLVIVTDTGGNRDWVSHGKNGWLCPPGDFEAFGRCLTEASGLETSVRKAISFQNRERVCARADWNRNFASLLKAYERATGFRQGVHGE